MTETEISRSGERSVSSGDGNGAVLRDRRVLEAALAFAGPEDRPAILAQMLDDLTRIGAVLSDGQPTAQLRAAHELKGLAATIGAVRLADMAALMQQPQQAEAARTALCMAMCAQVGQLKQELVSFDDSRRAT